MDFIKAKRLIPGKHHIVAIQNKLDGHRVMIDARDVSSVQAITRVGTDIWPALAEFPRFRKLIERLPPGTMVDCELHAPRVPATSVKTLINDRSPDLLMSAFALPMFDGKDGSNLTLRSVCELLRRRGFDVPETAFIYDFPTPLSEEDVRKLKERARQRGLEGYIAKESHLTGWYKIKPTTEIDAVITGWHISDSDSFDGLIKGVSCSLWDPKTQEYVEVCDTGNGLSKAFKEEMEGNEDSLIGKVVVIEYDSVAAKGRLKFPRITTEEDGRPLFRTDKRRRECLMEQLDNE